MKPEVYLINCPPGWVKTPPLGIEYLKRYLITEGIETEVLDLNIIIHRILNRDNKSYLALNENFEKNLFSYLQKYYPYIVENLLKNIKEIPFIGFSLFKRNNVFSLSLARIIKEVFPGKEIILGGPEAFFLKLHNQSFDESFCWVIGEGEVPIKNIVRGKDVNLINNQLGDLDSLPFLDFKGFDLNHYAKTLPLLSSRGCIGKCNFCTEKLLYKDFRQHSPSYMLEQIEMLNKLHGVFNFTFQDSLINADLRWLQKFCNLVIKKRLKINWEAQAIVRGDFNAELAKLLEKSGCFNLFIGLESASDKVLKNMNKNFTRETAYTFFNNLKKGGLHFEVSLIFGYPGEKEKEFNQTIDFIIKNKKIIPKIAQVNPFVDYFSPDSKVSHKTIEKVNKFINIAKKEKIPYTKSFINNLVYTDEHR